MSKPTVIVTGANTGLGKEAARELCRLGYDVVVSVRDDAKGDATIAYIKNAVPNARVMYINMELSEPDSIRLFVQKFRATGKKLHILLNNAGLFKSYKDSCRHTARADNSYELTMTVNCMGTFLLTMLLLDDLKSTATPEDPSRIVNISSGITTIYDDGKLPLNLEDPMMEVPGFYKNGMHGYRCSKLALNLWSNVLAKKLHGSQVVVNTFCPGFIPSTDLARHNRSTLIGKLKMWILDSWIGRRIMESEPLSIGRQRLVEYAETTGVFYSDGEPSKEASEVNIKDNQRKIWNICVKYSGIKENETPEAVKSV